MNREWWYALGGVGLGAGLMLLVGRLRSRATAASPGPPRDWQHRWLGVEATSAGSEAYDDEEFSPRARGYYGA
jgi:hypothetical protein